MRFFFSPLGGSDGGVTSRDSVSSSDAASALASCSSSEMVCIPCIVIPVLLWVYKRFLEPIIYPVISPVISRFWSRAAVQESGAPHKHSAAECNGTANNSTANGPKTVADKKGD